MSANRDRRSNGNRLGAPFNAGKEGAKVAIADIIADRGKKAVPDI